MLALPRSGLVLRPLAAIQNFLRTHVQSEKAAILESLIADPLDVVVWGLKVRYSGYPIMTFIALHLTHQYLDFGQRKGNCIRIQLYSTIKNHYFSFFSKIFLDNNQISRDNFLYALSRRKRFILSKIY